MFRKLLNNAQLPNCTQIDHVALSRFLLPLVCTFCVRADKASVRAFTCSDVPLIGINDAAENLLLHTGQQESVTCKAIEKGVN